MREKDSGKRGRASRERAPRPSIVHHRVEEKLIIVSPPSSSPLASFICDPGTPGGPSKRAPSPPLTYLAAPDLGPLRDRPPDEHEHLADGAALEEAKGREVRAEAEQERVRGVALPLSQDGDGSEAHGFFFFSGREAKR